MSNLSDLVSKVETIADATPEQWEAARAYVRQHAPDCADVLFGITQTREDDQARRFAEALERAR